MSSFGWPELIIIIVVVAIFGVGLAAVIRNFPKWIADFRGSRKSSDTRQIESRNKASKFCTKCGFQLQEGDNFCKQCGTSVKNR